MEQKGLCWNVYVCDPNGRINLHNVFDHFRFMESLIKNYSENKDDPKKFYKELREDLVYFYWCKFEWEILIDGLSKYSRQEKIGVYSQVTANWSQFCEYVWAHRKFLEVGADNESEDEVMNFYYKC